MSAVMDYPAEIRNDRSTRRLAISWQDGVEQEWSHGALRAACKCTHCQSQRLRGGPAPQVPDVRVEQLHIVGNYGLQLVFSDGHERGIYPWPYLRTLEFFTPA